jgi:hypothetical protein
VDPSAGAPGPTLWHAEAFCDSNPVTGYAAAASSVPFASIASVPGSVFLWGTGVSVLTTGSFSLPSPFSFFGGAKFTYRVNNNGWISFATPGPGFDFNAPIPTPGAPDDAIFAWWDDLVVRPGGFVRILAVPGGDLVVEWNSEERAPATAGPERASFQIVLHASPANSIELRYDYAGFASSPANPWDATVGLEDFAGTVGIDLTGAGSGNAAFPPQNLLLTPLPPSVPAIPPSMGSFAAAYNQGDIGVYTYDTGAPNAGAIESPAIVSTSANSALYLIFDTTRQVQSGAGSSFDQSFVEVAPAGSGAWTIVGALTLSPTCTGPVQTSVQLLPFSLAGTSFQHRFRFDTVDASANGYRGWYVDNVRIDQVLATTTPVFAETFDSGSVPGVSVGTMTEEEPTTGNPTNTLWHDEGLCDGTGIPLPPPLSGLAAAYHQGDIGVYTFDTGGANRGAISSPLVPLPAGTSLFDLAFDYLKEGEGGGTGTFDQCFVDVRATASDPWSTALQLTGNQVCAAGPAAAFVSGTGGPFAPLASAGTGQFRLRFDTVDGVGNSFLGWVVDNLAVNGHATAATLPSGPSCPGVGGCSPSIGWSGLPYVGNPAFEIRLTGAPPGSFAILVLGLSASSPPCAFPLPFPIGLLVPGNACALAVCPDSILPGFPVSSGPTCGGTSSLVVAIPVSTAGGSLVFAQWFVIDAGSLPSPGALSASPSLLVTIL